MATTKTQSSFSQHLVLVALLAVIFMATVFMFLQSSMGSPASTGSIGKKASSASSTTLIGFPTGGGTKISSSATTLIGFPVSSVSSSAGLVSTSPTTATLIGFPVSSSSLSSSLASLSSSSSVGSLN